MCDLGPADAICMCDFVCVHISFSTTHPYAFAFVAFRLRTCFDIMIGEPKAKKKQNNLESSVFSRILIVEQICVS